MPMKSEMIAATHVGGCSAINPSAAADMSAAPGPRIRHETPRANSAPPIGRKTAATANSMNPIAPARNVEALPLTRCVTIHAPMTRLAPNDAE